MAIAAITGPAWIPAFLNTLAKTGVIAKATEAAGVSRTSINRQRNTNLRFSEAFTAILAGDASALASIPDAVAPNVERNVGWPPPFLEKLAETSNVAASASYANVPTGTVYKARRDNPEFAAKWRRALYEGYEHLEMEVLAFLRGNLTDRKIDVANAIRQLAVHRKTVAEMRAIQDDENEQEVLDSIDAKIDLMKAEWAASEERAASGG